MPLFSSPHCNSASISASSTSFSLCLAFSLINFSKESLYLVLSSLSTSLAIGDGVEKARAMPFSGVFFFFFFFNLLFYKTKYITSTKQNLKKKRKKKKEKDTVYNILIEIFFTSYINKKKKQIYIYIYIYLHGFLFRMYVKTWFNCVIK